MLTPGQFYELGLPFALNEHGFMNNNPYLLKTAIQRRLYRVCPGWTMTEPTLMTIEGGVVVLTGSLILEGQAQGALGTGIILANSDPLKHAQAVRMAFKTAASDLLPRCALYFGVGWYLKVIPTDWKDRVKSREGLAQYLDIMRQKWQDGAGDVRVLNTESDEPREQKSRRLS
jgi:hypothetical protein